MKIDNIEYLEALKSVMETSDYLTNKEIHFLYAKELKLRNLKPISKRTFDNYLTDENLIEFQNIMTEAQIKMKIRLFEKLESISNGWQRYAWIIERKFADWNIRNTEAEKLSEVVRILLPEGSRIESEANLN